MVAILLSEAASSGFPLRLRWLRLAVRAAPLAPSSRPAPLCWRQALSHCPFKTSLPSCSKQSLRSAGLTSLTQVVSEASVQTAGLFGYQPASSRERTMAETSPVACFQRCSSPAQMACSRICFQALPLKMLSASGALSRKAIHSLPWPYRQITAGSALRPASSFPFCRAEVVVVQYPGLFFLVASAIVLLYRCRAEDARPQSGAW